MKVPKPATRRRPWVVPAAVAAVVLLVWGVRSWSVPGADPDTLTKEVDAAIAAGRHDLAGSAVARLARLRAPTPADRMLRARTALLAHRDDEAIAELSQIPDGDRHAAAARLLAGQAELRRHRVRFAEESLRAAIRLDPKLEQAHRELIYIYGILLRRRELYAEFLALARLVPLTFENAFHWCLTRNSTWDSQELIPQLQSYLAADPADRFSRLALGDHLRLVGRLDEADTVLAPLPASDPDARAARVRLALDRGDDRSAESLLAGGNDDHPELARLNGRLALLRREGPAAVRHFRAACQAEPDDRDGLNGLGQALTMVGDTAAAAPYVARSRDLDAIVALLHRGSTWAGRNDPALPRALGAACEKARRYPEAVAWYHLAVDRDPLDTDSQKALYRLRDHDPLARR